ncbi:MAG: hypothetical protein Q8R69_22955 [Telluria sp.]|nr:hypothetical protein [Telluria sp.]
MRIPIIKAPPQLATGREPGYLVGLGTLGERILILVDIDRLLAGAGLAAS